MLRYWETRFPELRPVTRAGNRRYYRPADVALIERIQRLLGTEGYTVKGVQKLLAAEGRGGKIVPPSAAAEQLIDGEPSSMISVVASETIEAIRAIRDRLQRALDAA